MRYQQPLFTNVEVKRDHLLTSYGALSSLQKVFFRAWQISIPIWYQILYRPRLKSRELLCGMMGGIRPCGTWHWQARSTGENWKGKQTESRLRFHANISFCVDLVCKRFVGAKAQFYWKKVSLASMCMVYVPGSHRAPWGGSAQLCKTGCSAAVAGKVGYFQVPGSLFCLYLSFWHLYEMPRCGSFEIRTVDWLHSRVYWVINDRSRFLKFSQKVFLDMWSKCLCHERDWVVVLSELCQCK